MVNVPLKSLIPGGEIDSRNGSDRALDTLVNSIRRLGLLLPLSVMFDGQESYTVVDGNRRLAALKQIHKGKKNVEVPVHLVPVDTDNATARAMSLAANIERLPLHPADQYKAFAKIAADGKALAEIADAFGISERVVRQRMALGSLSDLAMQGFKAGHIRSQLAQKLTRLTLEQQDTVVGGHVSIYETERAVDALLQTEALSPTSGLARYVTRGTYEAAGGTFVCDLFVEEGQELWADPALAHRMAHAMLNALHTQIMADGWQFFELTDDWVGQDYILEDPAGEPVNLSKEQIARANQLRGQAEDIDKEVEEGEDYSDEQRRQINAIEYELNELEDDHRSWTDEQKSRLGVVVDVHYTIHYGAKRRAGATRPKDEAAPDETKAQLQSTAVMMELDAHLTNAVRGALVDRPDIATRLLALTFLSDYFLLDKLPALDAGVGIRCDFTGNVLQASEYGLQDVLDIAKASGLLKAKTFEAKMKAMATIGDEEIRRIITFFVARSMMKRHRGSDIVLYLDKVKALKIRDHFTPTVDNLFGRLTKAQLKLLGDEANILMPKDFNDMKKKEAAEYVMKMLPTDWIPEAIRPTKPS